MTQKLIEKLAQKYGLKLTPLRKDVLLILAQAKQPLGAYAILEILRTLRESAEPPTVYRVLEFLEQHHVVHKLSHNNTYVVCKTLQHQDQASIVFTCNKCHRSAEFLDNKIINYLNKISAQQHITLTNQVLEINGECKNCGASLERSDITI